MGRVHQGSARAGGERPLLQGVAESAVSGASVDLGNRVPRQDRRERCPGPENVGTDRTSECDGEQQRVRGGQTTWAGG